MTADQWLISRPEIKTAEQLKGGSVAIAVFGGTSDSFARIALKRLGLTPVKDVAILQIGGVPERLSALQKGKVQAAMLSTPRRLYRSETGLLHSNACEPTLSNSIGGHYPRIHWENPSYVKSRIEAVHRLRNHNNEIPRLGQGDPRPMISPSADDTSPKQYPTLEIDSRAASGERSQGKSRPEPEDFVDMSFIKELDESGFVDDLYKSRTR